jgi:hypothetical protein
MLNRFGDHKSLLLHRRYSFAAVKLFAVESVSPLWRAFVVADTPASAEKIDFVGHR